MILSENLALHFNSAYSAFPTRCCRLACLHGEEKNHGYCKLICGLDVYHAVRVTVDWRISAAPDQATGPLVALCEE